MPYNFYFNFNISVSINTRNTGHIQINLNQSYRVTKQCENLILYTGTVTYV